MIGRKTKPLAALELERKKWVCDVTKALIRITFSPFYLLETCGREHLPRKKAYLMLPKHQCWQDIPLIAAATPQPLYYVAKHELFENPLISRLLKAQGGIPLNRQKPLKSRDAIRAMMQFLNKGEGVVVFPEGTYYPNRMGPGKGGILKLIISRLALPLIPVGIRYRVEGHRTRVTVSFGAPVYHAKRNASDETLDQIMVTIAKLSGLDAFVKSRKCSSSVIPAKAGIQCYQSLRKALDPVFQRGDDFLRDRQVLKHKKRKYNLMNNINKIYQVIDAYRDIIISLQRDLTARVALGPLNGGSGEHEKVDFIHHLLRDMKPEMIQEIHAPDEKAQNGYRPNLIARWEGIQKSPVVWVLAHADIVPPGNLSLWECDPYKIKVDGDRIIGRGVEDNQHGFVSAFLALKAILDSGVRLKRSVGLIVVADEETGSRYGLSYILKHHGGIFSPEDLIIVPDAGNEDGTMIEVAEKSMLWMKFTVNGRQCHASTPQKGKNSLVGAARLILALAELKEKFASTNPLFSPPVSTFEPTKFLANVSNVNTIPGKETFYMDCRILPEHNVDDVIETARQIASMVAAETKLHIEVESEHRHDAPSPTPATAPVVGALKKAVMTVTGREAKPMGIGGGTVAAFFREAGLPAAVWSTCPDTAHQPNECCLISHVITDAKVFAAIYQDIESA